MSQALPPVDLDLAACRNRQQRLLAVMERLDLDLAVVGQIEHVQYLTAARFRWVFAPYAALDRDGKLLLAAPAGAPPDRAAADRVVTYQSQRIGTLRNDQRQASSDVLAAELAGKRYQRIGYEFSSISPHLSERLGGTPLDIEPELYQMRRRKDADELALVKRAIAGTAAMHARAREIVQPGANELDVFNELQAAAVEAYGEMMTGTGNDYASGEMGGSPRDRRIEAGELYILDLGPAYRGYFADNTRAYAVGGQPTPVQQQAWQKVTGVFPIVEGMVRAGESCRAVFERVDQYLQEALPWKFGHHLGHGIGLFPHEAPHLNPYWDDTFQAGEVIAVEPGLYAPELRAGLRLENNYLVTETGVELLTPFPLEL